MNRVYTAENIKPFIDVWQVHVYLNLYFVKMWCFKEEMACNIKRLAF